LRLVSNPRGIKTKPKPKTKKPHPGRNGQNTKQI
jgi:hypothetical protein